MNESSHAGCGTVTCQRSCQTAKVALGSGVVVLAYLDIPAEEPVSVCPAWEPTQGRPETADWSDQYG